MALKLFCRFLVLSFGSTLIFHGKANSNENVDWEVCTKAYQAEIVLEKAAQQVRDVYAGPLKDLAWKRFQAYGRGAAEAGSNLGALQGGSAAAAADSSTAYRDALERERDQRIAEIVYKRQMLRHNFNECFS